MHNRTGNRIKFQSLELQCSVRNRLLAPAFLAVLFAAYPAFAQTETIGGGTISTPASGPAPSYGIGGAGMVLVKNWHFGTGGTIKNYADMSSNFFYHDQFASINNGGNYGSNIVSPDFANSIGGQPLEGTDSATVRQFTADSLKTFLTPLNGATTVTPSSHNAGNGSFMAKWRLPNGGSLLGHDIVWETRVRYVTPPYFWFAIWTAGNKWLWDGTNGQGAEHDLVESFGYDNGVYGTNYDGRYWHSNTVASPSKDIVDYSGWGNGMAASGITSYDATQYHTWTWYYKRDNTFVMYVDGIPVQHGSNYYWTYGNTSSGEPIDMDFLFDAAWGHNQVSSVNHSLAASALAGKYYEWNYSRVYLSGDGQAAYNGPHNIPGTVQAVDYNTGGQGVAYNQGANGGQTGFRSDNSSADYGSGIGWTNGGQWYKYTTVAPTGGKYTFSFSVASPTGGGTFHVEDENGNNLTGTLTAPNTGSWDTPGTVTASTTAVLSSGGHTLKWVQDTGGYNLLSMTVNASTASGAAATFVKTDTATQGSWKGVYGQDGYNICNDSSSNNPKQPIYGSESTTTWAYSWADPTSDVRGLQKAAAGSTARIAAQWGGDFDIDCNLTDSNTHQVALYALDWDRGARNMNVQVLDAATHAVLDTQNLNTFVNGVYFVWNIKGHVTFHLVNSGGSNCALGGIFFDPASGSTLITGTEFDDGAGPWGGNTANAAPKAFDGNAGTFYDCANNTGYVGIDAGTAKSVSKIVFAPRSTFESRMTGGVFEGSNTSATTGYTTLGVVTGTPGGGLTNTITVTNSTPFRWLRYRDSQGGNCNVAEAQFMH